jgi:hypothetical protein
MAWNTEFEWDDLTGTITVECIPNDDPTGYGTVGGAAAYGFPVCTATVEYPRRGYCFYGTEPVLFDSPSRLSRAPLVWLSYSFLATTPLDEILAGNPRRVVPLAGFSWGFELREDDSVVLRDVAALTTTEWEAVVPVVRGEYPSPLWTFADAM